MSSNYVSPREADPSIKVRDQEQQYSKLLHKLSLCTDNDNGSEVDFIIFVLHGIGTNSSVLCSDYRMIKYSLDSVKRYWFYQENFKTHLHLVNWKRYVIDAQNMLFDHTFISTAKDTRQIITSHILDIGFYLNARYCDFILESVVTEIDSEIHRLRHHPSGRFRRSKIAIIGYSMGSLILHEILHGNPGRASNFKPEDRPKLKSKVDFMFTVGSPLSCFTIFQSPQYMTSGMPLPEGVECYNVFHPYDPVAYRWEKLIYKDVPNLPEPEILPYWQNNGFKNWYGWERSVQQAKTMIVDNISDVASSIGRSIFSWWGTNKSNSVLVNNVAVHDKRLAALNSFKKKLKEKSVPKKENESSEDMPSCDLPRVPDPSEPAAAGDSPLLQPEPEPWAEDPEGSRALHALFEEERIAQQSSSALHDMNRQAGGHLPRRYDFQLQEDITEHLLSPLGILQSHTNYWSSKDLMFFVLKRLKKRHARVSIMAYLKSIRLRSKWLADCAANDDLRSKFLALSEAASSYADRVVAEDQKARLEASTNFSTTWSNLLKSPEEDFYDTSHIISDPID
ncbi:phospholipase DDHD1 [Babesia ovis]|uniref:Phospholipase DDHD1 n=1 Tax=Babesia ovis TaxID=5869 RepID=A0A9W5WUX8_BABOV|nr:phospholipase DDHD1 [Babesia ovis]